MENYVEELLQLIQSQDEEHIKEELANYHESDIAECIPFLKKEEEEKLFRLLGDDRLSDVLSYASQIEEILENLDEEKSADIVERMDADDAVDALQELDEEDRENILSLMEKEAQEEVRLILSYDEDEIGSKMTTNYILIRRDDTVKNAMRKLIDQAKDNDNISTIFVEDSDGNFCGAIDLKDLICARKETPIEEILVENYPTIDGHTKTSLCINDIRSYAEHLIPVLEKNHLVGVITSEDITEAVDEEMSEDYHKFAAITSDSDINEGVFTSIKKRLPWLILLLGLGLIVSMLISNFEGIIATLPVMVFFQSLILDMAGNAGTQSLAVTIRALSDEEITPKKKAFFIFREVRVGLSNGILLGIISGLICFLYLYVTKIPVHGDFNIQDTFTASCIVGSSLCIAMGLASFAGTIIPMLFKKIHVDPAVASGPLITTINDVVAVLCYYGLTFLFFYIYLH